MEILRVKVPRDWELVLFGDNQEGNALSYRTGYLQCIDYICKSKYRYAIHMGDEQEAYWIDDPRYSPDILQLDPLSQQKQVIEDLRKPANRKQLITILFGNHSAKLYPKVGNITKNTCEQLGICYGGFSCVVEFYDVQGIQFKGFFTHGRKSIGSVADDPIRRLANERLQLKRHLENKVGDCILMAKGHTHRLIVCEPNPRLYLITEQQEIKQKYTHNPPFGKGGYIHPDHRWYVNTGSFLKTFGEGVSGYSEMKEYDPVELGYIVVEIKNREIINVEKVVV